ncbi:MAG: GAF domain-containing protein [Deltaproteobacteria bacterium]|nr:GAF domain-containing protein [Deltaproteobacteria bacterium]
MSEMEGKGWSEGSRSFQEVSLLWELSRILNRSANLADVAGPVLEALASRMGMRRGTLTIFNRKTGEISIRAAHGLSEEERHKGRYRIGEGVTGRVVETGEAVIVPRISHEPRFLNRTGARRELPKDELSFICVPIKIGKDVVGALSADRLFDQSVSLEEDMRLLSIIASMIAQAVQLRRDLEEAPIAEEFPHETTPADRAKEQPVSTGIEGIDEIIDRLRIGDNVVWRVDDIEDYRSLVVPFVARALRDGRKVVYFQFADHEPLIEDSGKVIVHRLDPHRGFEPFSIGMHNIITEAGEETFYVFDSLSYLQSAWATDLMVGNFFMVMCPYLFELNTVACFAILRHRHSFQTVARIRNTTQVLIDVYHAGGAFCIHPLKVWNRQSPTMFLLHIRQGNRYIPVTSSVDSAKVFMEVASSDSQQTAKNLDYWDRLFLEAEKLARAAPDLPERQKMVDQLSRIMLSRESRMLALAREHMTLEDLLAVRSQLVGTGYIGGKAAGMLIARKMLLNDESFDWNEVLESHDSFYIGSDVFYSYLVQNGWWKLLVRQKTDEGYFGVAKILREEMKHGIFPDEIKEQFIQMIEYFGASPIIVRSSSLLEDSYGNAFAGKYESIFCINQGTPDERYRTFEDAVRRIFASTMNESALIYRVQRGLQNKDEQMALLVQRVSGSKRGDLFFPDAAGVGFSYNTFIWRKEMDPEAGLLRLVLGLGTRAVNRVENDYPRIVALDFPLMKPHGDMNDTRKFSQRELDILNIGTNRMEVLSLAKLMAKKDVNLRMDLFGVPDSETNRRLRDRGIRSQDAWILTFDGLLAATPFSDTIRRLMKVLSTGFDYPVDIEFTVNCTDDGNFRINLLQCRPLQTIGLTGRQELPSNIEKEKLLFSSRGNFMGGSIFQQLKNIIYVDAQNYVKLPLQKKYEVARIIGKLNHKIADQEEFPTMIIGPGRWGTTTPSLGVPVTFADISNMTVIAEMAYRAGDLMPELSFGTHFFQDLVETGIFYIALFPDKDETFFNASFFAGVPNALKDCCSDCDAFEQVVRVYDVSQRNMHIASDVATQETLCYSAERAQ